MAKISMNMKIPMYSCSESHDQIIHESQATQVAVLVGEQSNGQALEDGNMILDELPTVIFQSQRKEKAMEIEMCYEPESNEPMLLEELMINCTKYSVPCKNKNDTIKNEIVYVPLNCEEFEKRVKSIKGIKVASRVRKRSKNAPKKMQEPPLSNSVYLVLDQNILKKM